MGKKCFAPRCTTGYKSCTQKFSLFSAPKEEERLRVWRNAIPRKDRILQSTDHLCERHFEPHLVSKTWEAVYKGNVLVRAPRKASLSKEAVPTLFPDCPSYLSKERKQRKRPAERHGKIAPLKKQRKQCAEGSDPVLEMDVGDELQNEGDATASDMLSNESSSVPMAAVSTFDELFESPARVVLPSTTWSFHKLQVDEVRNVVFSELRRVREPQYSAETSHIVTWKLLDIDQDMKVSVVLMGKQVPLELLGVSNHVSTIEDITSLLGKLEGLHFCGGGPTAKEYPHIQLECAFVDICGRWRHKNCKLVLPTNGACQKCCGLSDTLRIHQRRAQLRKQGKGARPSLRLSTIRNEEKARVLRRAQYALKRAKDRLTKKVKCLQQALKAMQDKFCSISNESLQHKLNQLNIPAAQLTVLQECISAAKATSKKSRRYTENWLLLCLLLHIRSPSTYAFLRNNDILPLPCVSTVRKYLSAIRVKCGFDARFFLAFKKKLACKDKFQRHGVLVFDEIQVRKEMRVNSKTMTYTGFSDFGEIQPGGEELADHGLVFSFRSFGDRYSQPVAVFASKGPTKATILAQLVMKAIILLEEAGSYVDAIVSDGASTNRSMWTHFGVSGSLKNPMNSFEHPLDEKRRVYVFSDAPHLIKCARNRLHAQKVLTTPKGKVFWAHYDTLYVEDEKNPAYLKVCPKLTYAHVNPTNTLKMRVKLATQVYSRSVAKGLEYYSSRSVPRLYDVKATVDFTMRMNNLFDALNRQTPKEGLKPGCKDFAVLESSLKWLNEWEQMVVDGKILNTSFLTQSTAEGFRVTIMSALGLSNYLLNECGFRYVLTGKMNQDVLERFFGIIRQAGGQNDHPTMPTFLQLYNMLSIYSLIKPPKFGNCQTEVGQEAPCLTLSDLTSAFKDESHKETKLQELRKKLDGYIGEELEWESICDHSYASAEVVDCIVYYVSGFVCRKMLKNTKCDACKLGLASRVSHSEKPEAALVNCKTLGRLIHPSTNIFVLLRATEMEFQKNSIAEVLRYVGGKIAGAYEGEAGSVDDFPPTKCALQTRDHFADCHSVPFAL
ncbi:hypothetical protein HPB50_016987 [Hyalomma asiaticum]|uniref:Uncharacterized protein n=1 Tax=Hyalomma asiaticum TaxID=266040 RepID=A0ACB7TJ26_HYAAI|nr:hypothetical protein HPB50_016987 [Hyalomma asiaticum]